MHNSVVFSVSTELCSYHHNQFYNILITLKRNPILFSSHSPFPPKISILGQQLIYVLSI